MKIYTRFLIIFSCLLLAGCPTKKGNENPNDPVAPPVTRKDDDAAAVSALKETGAKLTENGGNIEEVSFIGIDVNNDTLAHLQGLPYLNTLEASSPDIDDDGMVHLAPLKNLTRLRLADCSSITDEGIKHFAGLENLEEVNLTRVSIRVDGLAVLAKLPKLKRIILTRTNTQDEGLKHLTGKETIELLDLNHCNLVTVEGVKAVATLKNLKSVKFYGPGINDECIKLLAGMDKLKAIGIDDTVVTDASFEVLGSLTNLEEIFAARAQLTDTGLAHLKNCKKLYRLGLRDTQITNAGLAVLEGMPIRLLNLSETGIGNEGMDIVAKMSELEDLNLWASSVTDEGVVKLSGLTNLKVLNLEDLYLVNDTLGKLTALTNLENLVLAKNDLSDEGMLHLKALTKLKRVDLRDMPTISVDVMENLKTEIPSLKEVVY